MQAMVMMAYANSILSEAVKSYSEAEALRMDKTVKWYQKLQIFFGSMFSEDIRKAIRSGKDFDEQVLAYRKIKSNEAVADFKKSMKLYLEEYSKTAKYMKDHGIDVWGDDKKAGAEKAKKKLTEIHNVQEFYDHQRAVALAELAALEDRITKSTLTGTLNSYTERGLAAERYYCHIS